MAVIHELLSQLDIFTFPVYFNINKTNSYKNWLGGIGTILMIFCFFLFFWSRFAQFIFLKDVTILEEQQYDTVPQEMELNKQNFMFAVNIMDDYGNIQNNTKGSFFKVELYQKQRYYGKRILQGNKYKDNDGNDLENLARDIPLELCTHEHFYDIQGLQNETLHSFYDINRFDEWLCPPKNEIIKIGGVFSSEDFLYLQMSAFLCNPSVDGDKCLSDQMSADQEEIQYKFMFFHTNFLVNRNADQIPTKAYISDFLFFHFRILYVSNWIDLYFREFQINTTYSVIGQLTSPDVSVFPIFLQGDQRTFSEYVDNDPSEKYDFELIELNLRRSPITNKVTRHFEQIDEFMAYVGGFIATLIGIFGAGLNFFKKKQYQCELANQIYNFERKGAQNFKKKKMIKRESNKKKNKKKKMTKREYIQKQMTNYYKKDKPLNITFKYYLSMIFCKKLFYGDEEKLIDVAFNKINHDIDLKRILETLQAQKKESQIIFTKEQKKLINLIPKKGLKPDDLEQERGFGDILKSLRNKKIKEIFKSQHINEQCLLNDEQINELYDLYQMAISEHKDITVQEQNQRILQSMKEADEYYYQIFDTIKYIDFIKDEELDEQKLKKEEQLQIQLDKIKLNIKDENNIAANKNGEIELQMPSSQAALKTGQNSKDNKQGEENGKKKKRFGCI